MLGFTCLVSWFTIPSFYPRARIIAAFALLFAVSLSSTAAQDGADASTPTERTAANRYTLTGTVTNAENGQPLPGAHVFITGTMVGTVTDADGTYRLSGVRQGAMRISVSMIGFEPLVYQLDVHSEVSRRYNFELTERVLESEGVVVEAERDRMWYNNLKQFETIFFGVSEWAGDCEIMNPEALRFDRDWRDALQVTAAAPIVIENRRLGYRIQYFLHDFKHTRSVLRWRGETLFTEMTPASPEQAARWAASRRAAYHGSLRHFLRALISDRLKEEQFQISRAPSSESRRTRYPDASTFTVRRDELLSVDDHSIFRLDLPEKLRVVYTGEPESETYARLETERSKPKPVQTSTVSLADKPVRIDRAGRPATPYGLVVDGYFAFHRSAGMLPFEYVPADEPLYLDPEPAPAPGTRILPGAPDLRSESWR